MSYPDEDHSEYPPTQAQFIDASLTVQALADLKKLLVDYTLKVAKAHALTAYKKDWTGYAAAIGEQVDELFSYDISHAQEIIDGYDDGYRDEVAFQYNTTRM